MELTRNFKKLNKDSAPIAGGKGASLGEMTQAGIPVPPGFVVLSFAFDQFTKDADLVQEIETILDKVDHKEIHTIESASEQIQGLVKSATMPESIAEEIKKQFKNLDTEYVAVRSSATAEDGQEHAWAGQLDSFLNTTEKDLLEKVQHCWASLFTSRAIFYRFEKGLHTTQISVAVVVQKMVNSEVSGIAFSVHPITEDRNQFIIEAGFGLGEAIVSGQITPDSYVVEKEPRRIIDSNVSNQTRGLYRAESGGNEWRELGGGGEKKVLDEKQILELSEIILKIENHYGFPCDIEWAFESGKFYIVQSRPITTLAQRNALPADKDKLAAADIINKIKKIVWDIRVQRPGFLQTKAMVIEGESQVVWLTPQHAIQSKNNLWVSNAHIYEQAVPDVLQGGLFREAFVYDKKWPIAIIDIFSVFTKRKESLVVKAGNTPWQETSLAQKLRFFEEYRALVRDITQYYIIAAPLAGYCERELEKIDSNIITQYAVPYQLLDLDELHISLRKIKNAQKSDGPIDEEIVSKHLNRFAWIKTAYNIIQEYTQEDVLQELSSDIPESKHAAIPSEDYADLIIGMQVGIYLRNRMKELSQQLWFASEPWIVASAADFKITREDFLYILPEELLQCFEKGTVVVEKAELTRRKQGFIFGIIEWKKVMITGPQVDELFSFLTDVDVAGINQFTGRVACRGLVRSLVRVIKDQQDFSKLQTGEILVAPMTTPDYVILMKRAGAVVTDEGGLSCHAAIVSRELNIPCVIGTKVATKVLEDGDLVEVDANNGIIKIIEKAKK